MVADVCALHSTALRNIFSLTILHFLSTERFWSLIPALIFAAVNTIVNPFRNKFDFVIILF